MGPVAVSPPTPFSDTAITRRERLSVGNFCVGSRKACCTVTPAALLVTNNGVTMPWRAPLTSMLLDQGRKMPSVSSLSGVALVDSASTQ